MQNRRQRMQGGGSQQPAIPPVAQLPSPAAVAAAFQPNATPFSYRTWDKDTMRRIAIHYDSFRVIDGAVLAAGTYVAFTQAQRDSSNVINGAGAAYQKDAADTSLTDKGRLTGESLVCRAFSVDLNFTGTLGTYFTTGQNITRISNPAPVAAHSPTNLIKAYQEYTIVTLRINNEEVFQEKLGQLPDPFGISGFAGAGVATDLNAYIQNGFGAARLFPDEFIITPNDSIEVTLQVIVPFTITQPHSITFNLHGELIDSIPRPALVNR